MPAKKFGLASPRYLTTATHVVVVLIVFIAVLSQKRASSFVAAQQPPSEVDSFCLWNQYRQFPIPFDNPRPLPIATSPCPTSDFQCPAWIRSPSPPYHSERTGRCCALPSLPAAQYRCCDNPQYYTSNNFEGVYGCPVTHTCCHRADCGAWDCCAAGETCHTFLQPDVGCSARCCPEGRVACPAFFPPPDPTPGTASGWSSVLGLPDCCPDVRQCVKGKCIERCDQFSCFGRWHYGGLRGLSSCLSSNGQPCVEGEFNDACCFPPASITVTRTSCSVAGVFGELTVARTNLLLRTVENPLTLLPARSYVATFRLRPNGHAVPWLLDAETGRSWILIHPGNYFTQSDGCIIVGTDVGKSPCFMADADVNQVTNSRVAMQQLMKALNFSVAVPTSDSKSFELIREFNDESLARASLDRNSAFLDYAPGQALVVHVVGTPSCPDPSPSKHWYKIAKLAFNVSHEKYAKALDVDLLQRELNNLGKAPDCRVVDITGVTKGSVIVDFNVPIDNATVILDRLARNIGSLNVSAIFGHELETKDAELATVKLLEHPHTRTYTHSQPVSPMTDLNADSETGKEMLINTATTVTTARNGDNTAMPFPPSPRSPPMLLVIGLAVAVVVALATTIVIFIKCRRRDGSGSLPPPSLAEGSALTVPLRWETDFRNQ